jgi:hypothetical protein
VKKSGFFSIIRQPLSFDIIVLVTPIARRFSALAAAAAVLSGCVAETVERRRPRIGPVKEVGYVDNGGGRVRYSTEGWGWFVSGRRRHAQRLMRKNCGKDLKPEIVDEYTRDDADIAYAGDDLEDELQRGSEHYKIAPFQHFAYECRPKKAEPAKAPTASTGTAVSPFFVVPARELLPSASTTTAPAPAPEAAPPAAPEAAPAPAAPVETSSSTAPAPETAP